MTRSVVVWDLARPHDQRYAQRPQPRASGPSPGYPHLSAIIALQRAAGNSAVTHLLTGRSQLDRFVPSIPSAIAVQRCGPTACDCASSEAGPSGFPDLQRQHEKTPDPTDVVLILSPESERADAVTEAAVMAPGAQIVFATSLKEMVKQLKALKAPVKTLFFVGHSDADGDIVFETPKTRDFVPAETIANSVKGVVQVETIDYQGCAVAVSPSEIEKVRKALKAKKARGSTCELVRQVAGPIKSGKKAITDRRTFDLDKAANRKLFDAGLKKLRDAFGDDRKKCIINDSENGYFQAHGKLIAVWANPESIAGNDAFDKGKSVCYGDLKLEQVDPSKNPVIDENHCKIVEVGK